MSHMNFGPSFMRNGPRKSSHDPSSLPASPVPSTAAPTFSSILTANDSSPSDSSDPRGPSDGDRKFSGPFRYSRELMLSLWNDSTTANLPIEMSANFHDIATVTESNGQPLGLVPLSEKDKKLFTGPLNSERRPPPKNLSDSNRVGHHHPKESVSQHSVNGSQSSSRISKRFQGSISSGSGFQGGVLGSVAVPSNARRRKDLQNTDLSTESEQQTPSRSQQKSDNDQSPPTNWSKEKLKDRETSRAGHSDNWRSSTTDITEKQSSLRKGLDNSNMLETIENDLEESLQVSLERNKNPSLNLQASPFADSSDPLHLPPDVFDIAGTISSLSIDDSLEEAALLDRVVPSQDPLQQFSSKIAMSVSSSVLDNTAPLHSPNLQIHPTTDEDLLLRSAAINRSRGATPSSSLPDLPSPTTSMWQYRDPQGNIQGPFVAAQMQEWFRLNYFSDDLLIKRAESSTFEPLNTLVRRVIDPSRPFISPITTTALPPGIVPGALANKPATFSSHQPERQNSFDVLSQPPRESSTDPWGVPTIPDSSLNSTASSLNFQPQQQQPLHPTQHHQQQAQLQPHYPQRQFTNSYDPFSNETLRPQYSSTGSSRSLNPVGGSYTRLGETPSSSPFDSPHSSGLWSGTWDNPLSHAAAATDPFSSRPSSSGLIPQSQQPQPALEQAPSLSYQGLAQDSSNVAHHPLPPAPPSTGPTSLFNSYEPITTPFDQASSSAPRTHSPSFMSTSSIPPIGKNPWNQSGMRRDSSFGTGSMDPLLGEQHRQMSSNSLSSGTKQQQHHHQQPINNSNAVAEGTSILGRQNFAAFRASPTSVATEDPFLRHQILQQQKQQQEAPLSSVPIDTDTRDIQVPDALRDSAIVSEQLASNTSIIDDLAGQDDSIFVETSAHDETFTTAIEKDDADQSLDVAVIEQEEEEEFAEQDDEAEEILSSTQEATSNNNNNITATTATIPQSKPAPWANISEDKKNVGSLRDIVAKEMSEADKLEAQKQAALSSEQEAFARQSGGRLLTTGPTAASIVSGSASSPSTNASLAPWGAGNNAPALPTKTLKDIQDEEGRRKAAQAKASGSTTPVPRGYAVQAGARPIPSVLKPPSTGAVTSSGASWSTVGANGKTISTKPPSSVSNGENVSGVLNTSSLAAKAKAGLPTRPTTNTVNNGAATAVPSVTSFSNNKPVITQSSNTTLSPSSTIDISPESPSPQFLNWCRESLKGLSVDLDDFIQMLLSFPINPDTNVLEIISDSVYANSSTLNGRRFANEFVSRRKTDLKERKAAAQNGGYSRSSVGGAGNSGLGGNSAGGSLSHGSSGSKASMASVVKTQSKPQQNEFNFTLVTKTKKKSSAR